MSWILTLFVGVVLGLLFSVLILLLVRYPRTPLKIGPLVWSGFLYSWVDKELKNQVRSLLLRLEPQAQIERLLLNPSTLSQVEKWLGEQIDGYVRHTLPEKWPMISMLIGEKTTEKVRNAISEHLHANWEKQIKGLSRQHLTNEQLIDRLNQIGKFDQSEHWSNQLWIPIKRIAPTLVFISGLSGGFLAVMGRFCYELLLRC